MIELDKETEDLIKKLKVKYSELISGVKLNQMNLIHYEIIETLTSEFAFIRLKEGVKQNKRSRNNKRMSIDNSTWD